MTTKREFPAVSKHTPRPVPKPAALAGGASAPGAAKTRGPIARPVAKGSSSGSVWSRFRLLPAIVVIAVVALGLKVTDLFNNGANRKGPEIAMSRAIAQPTPPMPPSPSADKKEEEETEDAGGKTDFTRAEVELLQQLSERRTELDRRERDIELRDNLLRATEKRIEEKIAELKKIEGRIDALLKKHDEQEEQRLLSVVKIYETMKPKDAAKVMERLDMPILLDVSERMKTAKMAAILAEMDTTRARAVTTELATRRRLPTTGG